MKTRKEIRAAARQTLHSNWFDAVIATLIAFVIICAIEAPSITPILLLGNNLSSLVYGQAFSIGTTVLLVLIGLPLGMGFVNAFLLFYRNNGNRISSNMFDGFKNGNYGRSIGVPFLVGLFTYLWSLLLIIPGIIKSYAYAMTFYIALDNPELPANDCIDASKEMMRGHKWNLFVLDLSFIGWWFLSILSCGIGFLWLVPYFMSSRAIFYEKLKAQSTPFQTEELDDED